MTQFPSFYIPYYFPSSILPSISSVDVVTPYVSGYPDISTKESLLNNGSGLFTGNFADYHQDRDFNNTNNVDLGNDLNNFGGDGINKKYVSPKTYKYGNKLDNTLHGSSGIFITFPPNINSPEWQSYNGSTGSGIFNFKELFSGPPPPLNKFSNAKESKDIAGAFGIEDFTIFNPYVHFDNKPTMTPVLIPWLSDLIATTGKWDRYSRINLTREQ